MRFVRFCAVILACVVTSTHAQIGLNFDSLSYPQTYSFDFKGDGARAAGMGYAFMAVSDDISAGSWNPAGLYSAELVTLGLTVNSFRPRGSGWGNMDIMDPSSSGNFDYDISDGFTGNFELIRIMAPVRIKGHPFVVTMGNSRSFEDYQTSAFKRTLPQVFEWQIGVVRYVDTNTLDLSIASNTYTKMNTFTFAFGTRLFGPLSGGLALNVYGGRSYREEYQSAYIYDLRLPTGLTYQLTDFARDVAHYDTTKFSGYNVTIGFKLTQEKWNGALVIKTPFSLSAKLDSMKFTISSIVSEYGQYYPIDNGSDTIIAPRNLTKYDIPMSVTLGGCFKVDENTIVASDIELRSWEGKKVKVRIDEELIPGSDSKETFLELDPVLQNTFSFRIGGERKLSTKIGKIPVRLGFGSIGLAQPNAVLSLDDNDTPTISYTSKRMTTLSIGAGIHWSQIALDFAFVRSSFSSTAFRDLGTDLSQNRDVVVGYGNVDTDNTTNSLMVGFTGVF